MFGTAFQGEQSRRVTRMARAGIAVVALVVATVGAVAAPAFATVRPNITPTIAFTPSSARAGAPVTFTGGGWLPYDTVAVKLVGSVSGTVCNIMTDSAGNLGPRSCVVPNGLPEGNYAVNATDSASNSVNSSSPLAVMPSISVLYMPLSGAPATTPTASAAVGQTVEVSGNSFAANSTLTAKFGSSSLALTPSLPSTTTVGAVSNFTFVVPSVASPGPVTVSVTDGLSNTATYILNIFQASISHSPAAGVSGRPMTFTGAGWPGDDPISMTLVPTVGAPTPVICATSLPSSDSTGTIDPTSCPLPTTVPAGIYTLMATDGSVTVADPTHVTVTPGVTLLGFNGKSTVNAAVGQVVGLSGTGFGALTSVSSVSFGSKVVGLPASASVTSSGSFTSPGFTVPSVASPGPVVVTVEDSSSNTATVVLNVFVPSISPSAATGASGHPVKFSGGGWPGNDAVSVRLISSGNVATSVCTVNSDSTGTVHPTSCLIPTTVAYGAYTLNAVDNLSGINSMSVNNATPFTVTSEITILGENNQKTPNAAVGQVVGVTGSGFDPSSSITAATFGGAPLSLTPATPTTTTTGTFSGVSFTVPSVTAQGNVLVGFTDALSHAATYRLDVFKASIAASATQGAAGTQISFSGKGWPNNDNVQIRLVSTGTTVTTTSVCTITADSTGTIAPQTCAVPTSVPFGLYTLNATDTQISINWTNQFTVEPSTNLYYLPYVVGTSAPPPTKTMNAAVGQVVGIQGNGFAASSELYVNFAGTNVGTTQAALTNTQGTYSVGNYATTAAFTVLPVTNPGPVDVQVRDSANDVANYTLNVYQASLTHTPANAVSGHQISFSGSGWPDSDGSIQVRLVLATVPIPTAFPVCDVSSNASGTIEPTTCTVPTGLAAGTYSVNAVDGSISVNDGTPFIMKSAITITNSVGGTRTANAAVGQTVGVFGTGWATGTALSATFNGTPVVGGLQPVPTINSTGGFSGTGFTVPSVSSGPVAVTVTDTASDTASYTLHVFNATITHSPSSGVSGQQLAFSGSGWPANDAVTLKVVKGTAATTICTVNADSSGTIASQTCTVPTTVAAGNYNLNATDGSISVNDSTPLSLQPAITITNSSNANLSSAAPGTTVYLNGTGFGASTTITTHTMGSTTLSTPSITTTSAGAFTSKASFTVPSIAAGTYTVTVKDALSDTATLQFTVT